MVGYFAAAMGELDNLGRLASWHYSVLQSGLVYVHYQDESQTWHAGSAYNNDTIGIEHEGGYDPVDEPLTPAQRTASVSLVQWLSSAHGFGLIRGNGLWEHHEVSGEPTQCPDGRIPWQYYTQEDEMWTRFNGVAGWWTGRKLTDGFQGTMQVAVDFSHLPAGVKAVDLELFINPLSAGRLEFYDGDGAYAGQGSKGRLQSIFRLRPVNNQAKFIVKGGAVTVDLLGIVGYLG